MTRPQDSQTPQEETSQPNTIRVSGYEMFVRRRQQRETMVFAWIGGIMAVLLVVNVLIFFGIIPIPFLNSFSQPRQVAKPGDIPCIVSSRPVSPTNITVEISNGTATAGLAKEMRSELEKRQIKVGEIGNLNTGTYEGNIKLTAGPSGINSAYTLARAFKESEIILDPRPTNDVTITIGTHFTDLISAEEFARIADDPLENREGCRQVSTD